MDSHVFRPQGTFYVGEHLFVKKRKRGPVLLADLYAKYSLSPEGLHGPYILGSGTNAKSLVLSSFGCFPLVWIHGVCGVHVKGLSSTVLYFFSNILGFSTL